MKMIQCTKLPMLSALAGLALTIPLAAVAAPEDTVIEPEQYVTEGRQGDVPWVSGGVCINEREYLQKMASEFNLKLEFAASDGSYLADVNVRIDQISANA